MNPYIGNSYQFNLKNSQTVTLTRYAAVYESRFTEGDLKAITKNELDTAVKIGYDQLLNEHANHWAELWEASDIKIDGDDDAQMGMRFSIYHLLASAPYHNDKISIPARGLQGQDYYGSIFWDCEIFVFPLIASTQPEAARNILSYRYHTLEGAKRKAKSFGFKGAYYAWQSQEAGDDQCALYVFTDPRTGEKIRSYFADEQIHISADIVYALNQYYQATGDIDFVIGKGAEITFEVAKFFASRSTWVEQNNRYEIISVLGPDEYHENVNNDAFTNTIARFCLTKAVELAENIQKNFPERWNELTANALITGNDIAEWRKVADKLYIPQPDPKSLLIEQFDGYFSLKDEPVEETRKRLAHPDLHPGGPLGPFQETQNIKQADIIMLLYLFRSSFTDEVKKANWEYYEPRTSHDSSLSPMAYSLVAADFGMTEWAYKYFIYTSHIDLSSYGPHWNLGVHSASLGGAWLAAVHGFAGVDLTDKGVTLRTPLLPHSWNRIEINLVWHGQPFKYCAEKEKIELLAKGNKPIPFIYKGETFNLEPKSAKLLRV